MNERFVSVVGAILLFFVCDPTNAGPIATLYNTGLADAVTPLPEGAIDPHYVLTQVPAGTGAGPNTYVAALGDWIPNGLASQWISSQVDQITFMNDVGSGNYTFRTTFDLTGFDSASAQISGRWSTDDVGLDILINGTSTGFTREYSSVPPYAFQFFTDFSISSGFVAGQNTLDFLLLNVPLDSNPSVNPMGLRVEVNGTANPVPEPRSAALSLIGATGLGLLAALRIPLPHHLRPSKRRWRSGLRIG